ncbi:MAG: NAD(P)H nitroreductase [Bacteroidetes bacterium]|nr:NAD(P)H nitroreductase [Bacteroidota bacterium]
MKFLDLTRIRQSVRKYTAEPVCDEKLHRCLEAARLAPSASNSQPWTFLVVDEPSLKNKVAQLTFDNIITFNRFVVEAPVLVLFVIEKPKLITRTGGFIKKIEYPKIDIGIAAAHFCLQAAEEGLGTCMLGWFRAKPIKKLLQIPERKKIGLIISVGYAPEDYRVREKSRKNFEEVVRINSYSSKLSAQAQIKKSGF